MVVGGADGGARAFRTIQSLISGFFYMDTVIADSNATVVAKVEF